MDRGHVWQGRNRVESFWLCFVPLFAAVAVLGRTGTRTVSKIANLILAAIAVKMVRTGVVAIITEHLPLVENG